MKKQKQPPQGGYSGGEPRASMASGKSELRRRPSFMPHGRVRKLQGGIGYVDPKNIDPEWKNVQLTSGMSLSDLLKLRESANQKGTSASQVGDVLGMLKGLNIGGGNTPYYGEGSSVSQALGPSMEAAFPEGYQRGGTVRPYMPRLGGAYPPAMLGGGRPMGMIGRGGNPYVPAGLGGGPIGGAPYWPMGMIGRPNMRPVLGGGVRGYWRGGFVGNRFGGGGGFGGPQAFGGNQIGDRFNRLEAMGQWDPQIQRFANAWSSNFPTGTPGMTWGYQPPSWTPGWNQGSTLNPSYFDPQGYPYGEAVGPDANLLGRAHGVPPRHGQ